MLNVTLLFLSQPYSITNDLLIDRIMQWLENIWEVNWKPTDNMYENQLARNMSKFGLILEITIHIIKYIYQNIEMVQINIDNRGKINRTHKNIKRLLKGYGQHAFWRKFLLSSGQAQIMVAVDVCGLILLCKMSWDK